MPEARYNQKKFCAWCGKEYYAARSNSRFHSDECRVAFNRDKKKPNFREKYHNLCQSMYDSITRLEKAAKIAEQKSQEMTRPLNERMMLIAMFREKTEIAKELKLLLEMNGAPDSWQTFLATKDPITYD